jgi:alpha-tubulin suppressor-like RCC1 family protein
MVMGLIMSLLLASCGGGGGGSAPASGTSDTATVGASGGALAHADGVKLTVPAGALSETLTLRVAKDTTGMNAALFGAAPDATKSVDLSPIYAMTPHGTRFAEPVELRIPISATAAAGPGILAVLRSEPGQGSWELIPVDKVEGGAAVVAIDGFSYYKVVRLVQMPVQPLIVAPAPFLIDMAATFDGVGPETFTIPSPTNPTNQHRRLYGEITSRTQTLHYAGRIVGLPASCANITLNGQARFPKSARAEDANGGTLGTGYAQEPAFAQTTAATGVTTVNGYSYPTLDFAFDLNMANAPYQRSVFEALRAANNTGATPTVAVSFNAWASCTTPVDMGGGNLIGVWKIAPGSEKVHDTTFNMDFIDDKGWVWNTVQYKVDYLPQGFISLPSDVTVAAGASASFSVSAWPTPVGEQRIEWWRSNNDGVNWTRVRTSLVPTTDTADTFTLDAVVNTDHNALFRVRLCTVPRQASVAESCTDGIPARLSVIQGVAAASFTQQPRALLVRTGQTASLSVQVAGTPEPTLRWQSRPANSSAAWSDVASGTGTSTANYSTAALSLAENGLQLRAVASNLAGEVASVPVTVSVSDLDVPPSVLTQPASLSVVAGSEAVFVVVARGTEALSYQWRRNGQPISGANAPLLKLSNVSNSDASVYSVQVSNAVGNVTSADATLQVSAGVAPAVAPSVVTPPSAVQVNSGNTVTFAVGAAGTGPINYQWLKNGQPVSGATAAFHSFTASVGDNGSSFSVVVSNSAGSVTSASAQLTVLASAAPTAVSISTHPSAQVQLPGGSATFAVAASGTGPLSYQWLKDGTAIAGATQPVLLLSGVTSNDMASYSVTVSNTLGSLDSTAASLTVVGAPAIGTQPASVSVVEGATTTFTVAASGQSLRYQWLLNGLPIGAATASSYTTPALSLSDSGGVYSVLVYNGAGLMFSQSAVLTVTTAPVAATPLVATAVAAGFGSSYAVDTLGDVWAWGYLVDPVTGGYKASAPWATTPVRMQGLFNVQSVVVVSETGNAYALHTDGTVSAWGRNDVGQLGDGTTNTRALPVKVLDGSAGADSPPIASICQIAAGNSALAMAPCDGSPVQMVGLMSTSNFGGATGAGLTPNGGMAQAVPGLPSGTVVAMAMPDAAANSEGGLLVSYSDGRVFAWGAQRNNSLGAGASATLAGTGVAALDVTATFGPNGNQVNKIEMGRDFTLVRWGGGAVQGLGRNVEGQLGNGTTNTRSTMDYVGGAVNVGQFSVGQVNVAALVSGNVWIWGWHWHDGSIISTPTQLTTGGGFAQLSLGDQHGLLIDIAGRVHVWGDGSFGALGTGAAQAPTPVLVLRP